MKRIRKGFTLIELLVVTLIMGILASMSMPYYHKTVETSKATDAVAMGHLLGSAYRMYLIDNPPPAGNLNGTISNSCNNLTCATATGACRLVACNYVAPQDWLNSAYSFSIGGSCPSGVAACARRSGGAGVYAGWGYDFSLLGGCARVSTAPDCPKF